MYLSPDPHPHRRFVENKGLSVIRPSGRPSGRSAFLRNFELALRVCRSPCGSPVFKDRCLARTLRRCRILADLIERIKGELSETVAHDALWPPPPWALPATIVVQAFFNLSVVLALLPTKGIPAAVHFLWRVESICDAGECGSFVEREPADGVRGFSTWKVLGGGTGNYISTSRSTSP
jgi:hypothetical protein